MMICQILTHVRIDESEIGVLHDRVARELILKKKH